MAGTTDSEVDAVVVSTSIILGMGAIDVKREGIRGEKDGKNKRIELANTYFFKARKSLTKGNKDEALQMFRASIAIQEEVYGTYHKRTARSYFFLAQTLFKHTNEYDRSLTAYRRAYRVGLALDEDHKYIQGTKRGIRDLLSDKKARDKNAVDSFFSSVLESVRLEKEGLEFTDNDNYESAIESFEKCFAIEEKAEGTFPLDLGHLHIRIAQVYRKQGEHGMAINAYRSALKIYESALGVEYADSKFCLRGIELSLLETNLSDAAIEEYNQSIFTSLRHCEKGDALLESKKFREAVSEFEAARFIEEKSLGKYPLTAAYIHRKLGLAFQSLKEYDRAILELRTALSIHIFECGDDHKSVVSSLQDIRSVMGAKGYDFSSMNKYMNTVVFSVKHERFGEHLLLEKNDYSGAIEEFQKSLGLEVSALGKYHLTQGGLFKAIGDAFLQKEVFDFAVVNYRNALVIYQRILGIEHGYTTSLLTSIGDAAHGIGLNTDQVDEYRKAVSESVTVEKTAENLINDDKEIEAIAAYRKAVRKEGSLIGDFHVSTADLHWKIAKVLKNMGRYDSALVSYRYMLAINLRSLGTDHMNTEHAHEDLVEVAILKGLKKEDAISYGQDAKLSIEHEDNGDEAMISNNYQSALNEYKKALEKEEHFLGDDHLVTEGIIRKILECQKLGGKTDQSFHFYRKMIRIYMKYSSPDYDADYMLRSLETTVKELGLSEAQKVEYIDIVKESVKCEMNGDTAEVSKHYAKAIDSYSRCLLMEQSLLGMLHPATWSVHKKIGSTFEKSGDIDSAIVSHSKALAILDSYLGLKEKETLEACNDLLNATIHKVNSMSETQNVGSSIDKKITTSSEESLEKLVVKRTQKKAKGGVNDVYSVFALLRNNASGEEDNRDGDKMEILKGLAQKWHDLDGNETIKEEHRDIELNFQSTAQGGKRNLKQQFDVESPQPPRFLLKKKIEIDVSKELGRANDMANAFKSPEGNNSKSKTNKDGSLFKSGTKSKGVKKLIGLFRNRKSGDQIESNEATQQKSTPAKSSDIKNVKEATSYKSATKTPSKESKNAKEDILDEPTAKSPAKESKNVKGDILYEPSPKLPGTKYFKMDKLAAKESKNAKEDIPYELAAKSPGTESKNVKEDISFEPAAKSAGNESKNVEEGTLNEPTSKSPGKESQNVKGEILYEPSPKSPGTKYFSMDIPAIPAFNANRNSKHDTEKEPPGASVSSDSSDSSMSSYESYESA